MESRITAGCVSLLAALSAAGCCATEGEWLEDGLEPYQTPRRNHTLVWVGDSWLVFGGGDEHTVVLPDEDWIEFIPIWMSKGDGLRFYPDEEDGGTWESIAFQFGHARQRHTAVWTGSEMLVWGGVGYGAQGPSYTISPPTDRGLMSYDPAANEWTDLSDVPGAPPAARDHAAVWTGSEMIVWGGVPFDAPSSGLPQNTYLSTGGVYSPQDGWSTFDTSVALGPEFGGRVGHTMTWARDFSVDGQERDVVVVFGGLGPTFSVLADGFWYDPATGEGGAIAPGPLAARTEHSAEWTGDELVVFGGRGSEVFRDGARYDPATGTWTLLPLECGPSARYDHVSAWTGNLMMIWGGSNARRTDLRGGSMYDVALDEWVAMPKPDAAPARRHPRGAWSPTQRELFVLGDAYDNEEHAGGGRFRPPVERAVYPGLLDPRETPLPEPITLPKP